jgi:hypothetical protein
MADWLLQRFAAHHSPLGDPIAFGNPRDVLNAANRAIQEDGVAEVALRHSTNPEAMTTISEVLTDKQFKDLLFVWGYAVQLLH